MKNSRFGHSNFEPAMFHCNRCSHGALRTLELRRRIDSPESTPLSVHHSHGLLVTRTSFEGRKDKKRSQTTMVVYIIYKSKVVKALHGVTRRIEQERHHH